MDVDWGEIEGPVLLFGGPYSNLHALEAQIAEAARPGVTPDRAICTGDVVVYCGAPAETVARIRDWGCRVIAGNCEIRLAEGAADCGCGLEEGTVCDALSAEWYAFGSTRIDADARDWKAALPRRATFTTSGRRFAAIHGGAADVSRFLWAGDDKRGEVAALEAAFGPVDRVVAGHSGIGFVEPVEGRLWINAGVIGMPPHDGRTETEFCLLGQGAELRRLPHDARAAQVAMAGWASPYTAALSSGWWPIEDVSPVRLRRAA